eukprot:CAMPEP_0184708420 /NCGR_PEP_ID=MMETSP0313-20130426/37756_1 /TAXON_ID=2792 /ORGANISM="Porphyridium aerugineum, Strain SAG 1380-2" /LENGTH=831 /DNA_ID=CAMNT_0027170009 /DNA_START=186 /DNA_END=2681 /DNA_ORIENTATION=-
MGNCLSAEPTGQKAAPGKSDSKSGPTTKTATETKPSANAIVPGKNVPTSDSLSAASYSSGNDSDGYFNMFGKKDEPDVRRLLSMKKSKVVTSINPMDDSNLGKASALNNPNVLVIQGEAMTMKYLVMLAANEVPDSAKADETKAAINQVFDLVDAKYNNWNDKSEVSEISKLPGKKKMPMSPEIADIFNVVDTVYDMSGGRFDPTIAPLTQVWAKALVMDGRPPLGSEVSHLRYALGWKTKVTRKDNNAVQLENTNTAIDLCGIAKGYCVDLILEKLSSMGLKNIYVDWAGDIRSVGKHPDGRSWRSAVMTPPELKALFELWRKDMMEKALNENDARVFYEFAESGAALATSGDYFRLQKFGYHHIIDIENMSAMKASPGCLGSASIVAKTCAIADALATAAMTFSTVPAAKRFLDEVMANYKDLLFGYALISRGTNQLVCTSQFISKDVLAGAAPLTAPPLLSVDTHEELLPSLVKSKFDHADPNSEARLAALTDSFVRTMSFVAASTNDDKVITLGLDTIASCSLLPTTVSFHLKKSSPLFSAITSGVSKSNRAVFSVFYINADMKDDVEILQANDSWFTLKSCKSATSASQVAQTLKKCVSFQAQVDRWEDTEHDMSVVLASCSDFKLQPNCGPRLVMTQGLRITQGPVPDSKSVSDHPSFEDDEKLKRTMKPNPSPICLLTATSADGKMFGLTASSVRIAKVEPGIFSFNVQKSAVFRTALGFQGTYVNFHFLKEGDISTAEMFVQKSEFAKSDVTLSPLVTKSDTENGWAPIVSGFSGVVSRVDQVLDFADHLVYVCKVLAIFGDDPETLKKNALLYSQSAYITLE